MTQLEMARRGEISEEMVACARREALEPEIIRKGVEDGTLVIVKNRRHSSIEPLAIGKGLRTKVNANIGTSRDHPDLDLELAKVKICEESGADTIMDLSTGGDISAIRGAIINASSIPLERSPFTRQQRECSKATGRSLK
jgi:phosphomethylpyrimidine synthase